MTNTSLYSCHIGAILRVLIYIEEHLDEPLLLEALARTARVSPFHFHRLFRAYVGATCLEYIQKLRLQRAEEKLRYTDRSITSIALDVGYETPAGFSKIFQQVLGRSPREYRKVMQPVVKKMLQRTLSAPIWTPSYQMRAQVTVLFVRRVGDYKETPELAFEVLLEFLAKKSIEKNEVKSFYSVALDDPNIVDRMKCRFDACVSLSRQIAPEGEVGEKKLASGLFACFEYRGPTSGLEGAFDEIYRSWYSAANVTLSDKESFCEHVNFINCDIEEKNRLTTIYIPIQSRRQKR